MHSNDLVRVLDDLGRPRVLVLGDLMLDRYTWGNAERISPEAPVIVLRVDRHEARPGGAANVVNMLCALEARVTCCGVVGDDAAGGQLSPVASRGRRRWRAIVTDPRFPTSVKERFFGRASGRHPSQMLRVDHEHAAAVCESLESQLIETLNAHVACTTQC